MILVIEENEQKMIDDLIARAAAKPISLADLAAASKAVGIDLLRWKQRLDEFTIALPEGFLVTFTHEQQPMGLCRHIAVSADDGIPLEESIFILFHAFRMRDVLLEKNALKVWPEYYESGRVALNVIAQV